MTSGRFHLAGIMGDPVMHSRSPLLHGHWLVAHGLAGAYVPFAVKAEGLPAALRALAPLGFAGCNLTLPHKEAALSALDAVDEAARRIGAVNCVVVGSDGHLEGRNYDHVGYVESLREAASGWRAEAGPAVVIGAGGGARAVAFALARAGAREIRIVNRGRGRADALAAAFGPPLTAHDWADREALLADAALVVNTTSLGMAGQGMLDLSLDRLPAGSLVSDIVYAPLETPLLAAARRRGNPTVDGLGMLLHQAVPAFEAWFGIRPAVTPELRRLIEATIP